MSGAISDDAADQATDTTTITARSELDPSIIAEAETITTAIVPVSKVYLPVLTR